jgi:hypothetical protein
MTITFPRDFPLDGCFTEDCIFEPIYSQTRNITGGGSPDVADVAPMLWSGKWRTRVLTRAEFAVWDAWLDSLRGGLRYFKGRPNRARWPLAYPRGFAGLLVSAVQFTGSGTLTAIGAGRDTITVSALPVGFVLAAGDWLSIPVGSRQRLHKITEGGTASGGGAVDLTVEPIISPGVTVDTPPAVLFDGPWCDMNLSTKPDRSRGAVKGGAISFEGMQKLI